MRSTNATHHQGFRLIELSIVIVIVGLIVGGVVIGSTLIESAALRKTVKNIDQFRAAALTFREKYNCIPGNCPYAQNLFGFADPSTYNASNGTCNPVIFMNNSWRWTWNTQPPSNGTCNGNGNGSLDGGSQPQTLGGIGENLLFWHHLTLARLVSALPFNYVGGFGSQYMSIMSNAFPGTYYDVAFSPVDAGASASGPPYTLAAIANRSWFLLLSSVDFYNTGGALTPRQAFALDSKIDDGMPGTGVVPASGVNGGLPLSVNYGSPTCLTTTSTNTSNTYNTNLTAAGCNIAFLAGF